MKGVTVIIGIIILLLNFSCKKQNQVNVKIERFDTDLYQLLTNNIDSNFENSFVEKYADFVPIYIGGVLRLQNRGNEKSMSILHSFFQDSTLMRLYADEQAKFRDVSAIERSLSEAISTYKLWFPKDSVPTFRMHVSGLTQSVITSGSVVSISGDKYLGKDYPLYKSYFYEYQLPTMQTENVVCDALKAFLEGRFPEANANILVDRMIYQGVVSVTVEQMLPEQDMKSILGYDAKEFEWLDKNEKNIWIYMVENEQLYTTDQLTITKYMEEAPFTSFFGQSSPARIGRFIGYKIVKSYLKKKNLPISSLLPRFDAKNVLAESGYRP